MATGTLEDHLRRATRNFTAKMPEEAAFALGKDLARELERAHGETPPRFPAIEPGQIPMSDGRPRLEGTTLARDAREGLFELGVLLQQLVTAASPHVSWRLDGPPPAPLSSLTRRAALASLTAVNPDSRFASAAAAAEALEAELGPKAEDAPTWPFFRGTADRVGAMANPAETSGLSRGGVSTSATWWPRPSSPRDSSSCPPPTAGSWLSTAPAAGSFSPCA